MIVAIISPEKAEELKDQEYTKGVKYNPVAYGENFYISLVEAQYLRISEVIEWIDYVPEEVEETE